MELILFLCSVVVIACVGVLVEKRIADRIDRLEAFFEDRVIAQDKAEEGRRLALYKQQKKSEQNVARSDVAVRKLADQTRVLKDEAEHALRRVDRFVSDQKREGS